SDQRIKIPGRAPVDALGWFVVDADLAEPDPAREPLEKSVALGELLERRGRARRQQTEVASVGGGFLPRAPIDQRIERLDAKAARPRLVRAVRLGRVDHVVAVVEPIADEPFHQRRRVLSVTIHEQDSAEAGMIEPGEQRRLLAEIARERDDLDIEAVGPKLPPRGGRPRAAALPRLAPL